MRYTAIEFDNTVNNTHYLGYLRIPDRFNPKWHLGFREYINDKYKPTNGCIVIYPLNVSLSTPETIGKIPSGYKDMREDFLAALRDIKYYPKTTVNMDIRRQWAELDIRSADLIEKKNKIV